MPFLLASDEEILSVSNDSTSRDVDNGSLASIKIYKNICLVRIRSCQPGGGCTPRHEEKLLLMKRVGEEKLSQRTVEESRTRQRLYSELHLWKSKCLTISH